MNLDVRCESADPTYRILAVDDEPEILETYRKSLTPPDKARGRDPLTTLERDLYGGEEASALRSEFALTCCEAGSRAIETVAVAQNSGAPFTAILLDKAMPDDIDGLIVAREVRRIDPQIVIVFVTGDHDASLIDEMGSLAEDDRFFIFYKPFYAVELKQFLSAICAKAHLERRLFAVNASLEAKINDRTAALAEAKERAEAASHAKSAFLANISHEVRTPLNGILGMAALMGQTRLDRDQEQKLDVIRDSGEWLLEIINGLLEMSSIEAGEVHVARELVDIAEVLRQTLDLVQSLAIRKDIHIASRVELDSDAVFVGDHHRIKQVLTNLVGNAIKFSAGGEITIEIRQDDAQRMHFSVTDQGPGIDAELLPWIFERFRKDEHPGSSAGAGTGLGLAISKELVELMDGEIGVETEAGRGSTFWFVLPLRQHNRSLARFLARGAE